MGVTTCPTGVVNAPLEQVWALLTQPSRYLEWHDMSAITAEPPGPAQPGQVIREGLRVAGHTLYLVTLIVRAVDAERRQITFESHFPLGISGDNRVNCVAIDPARCRVSYG